MKRIFLLNFLLMGGLTCLVNNVTAQIGCTISCPPNITVNATANQCGAVVNYGSAVTSQQCGMVTYSQASGTFFPVGTTLVTASTAGGQTCTFSVTVLDRQAPTISGVSAVPPSLWPPNHKMVTVKVNYSSSDNCPGVTCRLAVSSNEPVNSTGDGNTAPDYIILDNQTVQLRAERKGNGNGRIYTISITCTDRALNATTTSTNVVVPHDMSGKTRSESGVGNIPLEQSLGAALTVKVLSNPTRNAFSLNIQSLNKTEKVTVRLFDLSGRMVESKNNINAGEVISVGSQLGAGTYLAEFRQGSEYLKLKLVKL